MCHDDLAHRLQGGVRKRPNEVRRFKGTEVAMGPASPAPRCRKRDNLIALRLSGVPDDRFGVIESLDDTTQRPRGEYTGERGRADVH